MNYYEIGDILSPQEELIGMCFYTDYYKYKILEVSRENIIKVKSSTTNEILKVSSNDIRFVISFKKKILSEIEEKENTKILNLLNDLSI